MLPLFWRLDILDCCCAVNRHSQINFVFSQFYKIVLVLKVTETKVTIENASSRDRFRFGGDYESEWECCEIL